MNKPQPNDSEDNALWEEITRDIRKLPAGKYRRPNR